MALGTVEHAESMTSTPLHTPELHAHAGFRRIFRSPAIGLFFLSPLIAEFFLGDFPIVLLPLIVPLSLWYGGCALGIREIVRRRQLGWLSILLLAAAFAVVEEGVLTMSLFNPDYAHLHLLAGGYIPALGIGVPWTVFVLTLHIGWSIATPIALIESSQGARAAQPWLRRRGAVCTAVAVVVGAVIVFATNYPAYGHFLASPAQVGTCLLIAAVLVAVALLGPSAVSRRSGQVDRGERSSRKTLSPWVLFALTLIGGAVFELGRRADGAALATSLMLIAIVAVLTLLGIASRWVGWSSHHRFAVASALLFTYSWNAFVSTATSGSADALAWISDVIYLLAAVAIAWRCRPRVR